MDETKLKELLLKICSISSTGDAFTNARLVLNNYRHNLVFEFCPYLVNLICEKYNKTFQELRKDGFTKEFIFDFILANEDKINEDFLNRINLFTGKNISTLEKYNHITRKMAKIYL